MPERLVAAHNLHGSTAQNKARTHEYGITYLVCRLYAVLDFGYGTPARLRDVQLFENFFKRISVFRALDGVYAVPMMLTSNSLSLSARLIAVCPPKEAMTPIGFSSSRTLSTSSTVSGSKYSLSAVV